MSIWLSTKWEDVVKGNPKYGFPGISESDIIETTNRMQEALSTLIRFQKYQRDEYRVTTKHLLYERNLAEIGCRSDVLHGTPTVANFIATGLPSKNPANVSTNLAYLQVLLANNPNISPKDYELINRTRAELKELAYNDSWWDSKLDMEQVRLTKAMPIPPDPPEDH